MSDCIPSQHRTPEVLIADLQERMEESARVAAKVGQQTGFVVLLISDLEQILMLAKKGITT